MNRSTSPTDVVTPNARGGAVLAAIPVRRLRAAVSERIPFTLARRMFRSIVATTSVERRPVRTENDASTRIALKRDGISIDRGRPRGGAPRDLDGLHYDLLRQFR